MKRIPGSWPRLAALVRCTMEEQALTLRELAARVAVEPSGLGRAVSAGHTGCGPRGLVRAARAMGVREDVIRREVDADAAECAGRMADAVMADGGAP